MDVYCLLFRFLQITCINTYPTLYIDTLFVESRIGSFFRDKLEVGLNIVIHIFIGNFKYNVTPTKKQLIYV